VPAKGFPGLLDQVEEGQLVEGAEGGQVVSHEAVTLAGRAGDGKRRAMA
jgi:hypothetical protein